MQCSSVRSAFCLLSFAVAWADEPEQRPRSGLFAFCITARPLIQRHEAPRVHPRCTPLAARLRGFWPSRIPHRGSNNTASARRCRVALPRHRSYALRWAPLRPLYPQLAATEEQHRQHNSGGVCRRGQAAAPAAAAGGAATGRHEAARPCSARLPAACLGDRQPQQLARLLQVCVLLNFWSRCCLLLPMFMLPPLRSSANCAHPTCSCRCTTASAAGRSPATQQQWRLVQQQRQQQRQPATRKQQQRI